MQALQLNSIVNKKEINIFKNFRENFPSLEYTNRDSRQDEKNVKTAQQNSGIDQQDYNNATKQKSQTQRKQLQEQKEKQKKLSESVIMSPKDQPIGIQNMANFFNFVFQFKTGNNSGYKDKVTSNKITNQRDENQLQNSLKNSFTFSNGYALTDSHYFIGDNQELVLDNSRTQKQVPSQSDKKKVQIHYGYQCDKCLMNPIIGYRYNCKQCDYDLCSSCYSKYENSPDMHIHGLKMIKNKLDQKRKLKQLCSQSQKLRSSMNGSKKLQFSEQLPCKKFHQKYSSNNWIK